MNKLATPLRAEPIETVWDDNYGKAKLKDAEGRTLCILDKETAAQLIAMSEQNRRMREALELLNLTAAHSHDCTEAKCHDGCEYRIISAALGREGRV